MMQDWKKRLSAYAERKAKRFMFGLDKYFGRYSKVGDQAFYDPITFPWVPKVEAEWQNISTELDEYLAHFDALPNFQDLSPDQRNLTQDDRWKTIFFYAYGLKARGNLARCPATARALKHIPGLKTAFFSILGPHKTLPSHRGPFKGVLRYHLGLVVPEPAAASAIKVNGEQRHWREGGSLIFDDTYQHEAWNGTDKVRAVLFVDFVRPLRFPASLYNTLLLWLIAVSPFVLGSAGRELAWEKRFERIVNAKN